MGMVIGLQDIVKLSILIVRGKLDMVKYLMKNHVIVEI